MAKKYRRSQRATAQKNHCVCPICCIVPPHMVDEVLKNGDTEQRGWAVGTLRASEQFRGRREVMGFMGALNVSAGVKRRTIYDAKNTTTLPGTLVRNEGDPPSSDAAVNEAYDAAGATYDLFKEVFERNSIDDQGLRLESTVHYDIKYDNAFWNGNQMVYGDGDGQLFDRFTKSIDVIGHELTHGVTQYEAALDYYGEPGALNESFSDVFGILVKQRWLKQTVEQSNWMIGEGLLMPNVKGFGIRSMKEPGTAYNDAVLGKDPQPGHLNNMYKGTADNAGVHINSGIANRAFYLAAMEIGGYAWEKTGKIWYISLRDRLRNAAGFKQAADSMVAIAGELYGVDSQEQKAVKKAWHTVGIT
jgi:Zn-dependent metalloprotease